MAKANLNVVRMNVAAEVLKLHAKLEDAFTGSMSRASKTGKDRTAIAALKEARDSLLAVVDG